MTQIRYEVKHDNVTVFVQDMTGIGEIGTINAYTKNGSTAELSDLGSMVHIENLNNPIYYFNRIKANQRVEGTGEGKALMIEVCKIADKHGITILNELNPYGNRDMKSLKEFFKASGFENFSPGVMVRKPKGWNDE